MKTNDLIELIKIGNPFVVITGNRKNANENLMLIERPGDFGLYDVFMNDKALQTAHAFLTTEAIHIVTVDAKSKQDLATFSDIFYSQIKLV